MAKNAGAGTVKDMVGTVKEALTVRRVFGQPYEKDGVTVIPVASLWGGMGGGDSQGDVSVGEKSSDQPSDKGASGRAHGGGLGVWARPVGVYVIDEGEVWFQPVVSVNLLIAAGASLAGLAVLALPRLVRARAKAAVVRASR